MANLPDLQGFSRLVNRFEPEGRLVEMKPLHGGLSTQAVVLTVELASRAVRKFVVRRPPPWMLSKNPDIATVEFRLLQSLSSQGLRVQKPICLDANGECLGSPSLTLEYVEASTNFSPPDLEATLRQMAVQLAKIHRTELTEISGFLPAKDVSISPPKPDVAYSEAEKRARDFLAAEWPRPSLNLPVLTHGDYWPGNILWNAGNIAAVLDWEMAGICDPLYDLAVAQLDIFWLYGREAMDQFLREYRQITKFDFSDLPFWNLRAALRTNGQFAIWASVYPGLGRPDVTESTMRERHREFVDLALETFQGAG